MEPSIDSSSIYSFSVKEDPLAGAVKEALRVIDNTLDSHSLQHIAISFNGGKDCTVLLHLLAAALHHRSLKIQSLSSVSLPSIKSVYITCPSPFPEVESFISDSASRYNLRLERVGGGMKEALTAYLHSEEGSSVEAMLIGTRRGDPHGASLDFVNPTDGDWPPLRRVHPIINWSYGQVWDFLRKFSVPYCVLYDHGYTSLGSTYNTFQNPALRVEESDTWKPAYELVDGALERAGRYSSIIATNGHAEKASVSKEAVAISL